MGKISGELVVLLICKITKGIGRCKIRCNNFFCFSVLDWLTEKFASSHVAERSGLIVYVLPVLLLLTSVSLLLEFSSGRSLVFPGCVDREWPQSRVTRQENPKI